MPRNRYKNPPIIEAICEVRFAGVKRWDVIAPGRMYPAISHIYDASPEALTQVRVLRDPTRLQVEQDDSSDRVKFVSSSSSQLAIAGPSAVSIHVTKPYPDWENFRPDINIVLQAYLDIAQPTHAERIGVRYINQINIRPSESININDYINIGRATPMGLPTKMTSVYHRIEHQYEDGVQLVVAFATGGSDVNPLLLLDLDVVHTGDLDLDRVLEVIDNLHEREGEAFETLITPTAREIFNAETGSA
ncbi:MAG: TIGR04255 family protein [Myxococcales bacterium]|nr:TIGR04255 family protein [Myxococcales bacterium]